PRGTVVFEDAIVEIKFDALGIERSANQGWQWFQEFDRITPDLRLRPELRKQRDALALLAAFVQHADNKPEQQRLVCLDNTAVKGGPSCAKAELMINDLGFTFGQGFDGVAQNAPEEERKRSRLLGTASVQGWEVAPLWKRGAGCTTEIHSFVT